LQLGQRVIGGHGLFKCARRTAEFVVKLTHAVERDFSYEEVEILSLRVSVIWVMVFSVKEPLVGT